jgi:hypothetical protein
LVRKTTIREARLDRNRSELCVNRSRFQAAQSSGESIHALNLWAGHAKTDGAEINWSDLKFGSRDPSESLLGKGTTGQVYKMKWMSAGGLLVAVKIFHAQNDDSDSAGGLSQLEQFRNETQMLAGLRCACLLYARLRDHLDC